MKLPNCPFPFEFTLRLRQFRSARRTVRSKTNEWTTDETFHLIELSKRNFYFVSARTADKQINRYAIRFGHLQNEYFVIFRVNGKGKRLSFSSRNSTGTNIRYASTACCHRPKISLATAAGPLSHTLSNETFNVLFISICIRKVGISSAQQIDNPFHITTI